MTDNPDLEKRSEFMADLWARVAEQDAEYAARFAAIMTRKPARPRKVEPPQAWLAKAPPTAKKNSAAPPDKAGKFNRKKGGPMKW
jgi:hypothetical protein